MIFRTVKVKNFSVISNTILTDTRLSWEARGMAAYMLSKPDTWRCRLPHLMEQGHIGRDRTYRILKELETAGYLHRQTVKKPDGTFDYEQILHEEPEAAKPEAVQASSGEAVTLLNTERVNTERERTKKIFRHRFPDGMALTEDRFDLARKLGVNDPKVQWERFSSHYRASGALMLDWDERWRGWCLNVYSGNEMPRQAAPEPPRRVLRPRETRYYDQARPDPSTGLQSLQGILKGMNLKEEK